VPGRHIEYTFETVIENHLTTAGGYEMGDREAFNPAVFFHELAHAAHSRFQGWRSMDEYNQQETVVEFTACALMQLYGLGDSTGNAWQYLGDYASDPRMAIVKALGTVEKALGMLGV